VVAVAADQSIELKMQNNMISLTTKLRMMRAVLFLGATAMIAPAWAQDPADFVDPFIGAASTHPTKQELARLHNLDPSFEGFHGKLFPGACLPDGMVQLSPDTILGGDNGAGYSYPNTTIQGFSFNHMSGVGAYGDLGNLLVTPTEGPLQTYWGETDHPGTGYLSGYSKDTEVAQAGYYAVTLDDYKVRAEMTAALRSGILRFTFPQSPNSRVQIDLSHRIGGTSLHQTVKVADDHSIEGQIDCTGKGGGFRHGPVNYTLYYRLEFNRPLHSFGVWSATLPPGPENGNQYEPEFVEACKSAQRLVDCREKEGQHLGFYAEFPTHDQETILVKAGISYVSLQGARDNVAHEIPAWDFDAVRKQAHDAWVQSLRRISVDGGTDAQKTTFYTAFYHSLIDPRLQSDVDGNYPGGDGKPHRAEGFSKRTIFSGWDVYRSQYPLLTIVAPRIVEDQINSAVALAQENRTQYFDRWELMNSYTGCMCGSPEVIVINDAYQKGLRHFDAAKAYQYSVNTCRRDGNGPRGFSTGGHGISVSLENDFCDWNLSQLAKGLDKPEDAKIYAAQSQAYRMLFDPAVSWTYDKAGKERHEGWKGWFRNRDSAGNPVPWEGLTSGNGGMESSILQNGWFVPQDIPGLIELNGGKDLFVQKLSEFFDRTPKLNQWNNYDNQPNEPSHLIPFLFNRAGAPWLTQKWVRRLVTETYSSAPNGLCGDDDEGQVSAWFVLAASGLHQACPGDPRFEIFAPLFDKVTINLDPDYSKGGAFVIIAKNNSPQNVYIQSATLNGKAINRCWLNYSEITAGGNLELVLGPQPNKNWGLE
jgi:predicted alpha-1,2-mannosidase